MYKEPKRTKKEKSTSFYIDRALLNKIDFIADFEGQSRSVIVEVCVQYFLKRSKDAKTEFARIKRKFYKRKKTAKTAKGGKATQMLHLSQGNEQSLFETKEL